jgi:hypothetical protein
MEQPNALVKIALNEVVNSINSGTTPTTALKKVASDLDLNPNYVHRVGEALNVALHYNHFKKADDRSAQFEIADIPAVVKGLFNETEKTGSQKRAEAFPDNGGEDTVFNYNRILNNPKYKKAYLEIINATETHESFPLSLKGAFEKSANLLKDLERDLDEAKTDKVGSEIDLNQKFSSLSDHFRKDSNYRLSFDEFESQVFSKYGEQAVPYLDLLHKTSKTAEDRGVHDKGYQMFESSKELAMFDSLMKAAEDFAKADDLLKEAEEKFTFEKEYYSEIGKLVANNGSLSKNAEQQDPVRSKKKNKQSKVAEERDPVLLRIEKKAKFKKSADVVSLFALSRLLNQSQTQDGLAKNINDRFLESKNGNSPKHNLVLENMERQLLLQELIMTDPILSKSNPQKVAKAYEQILRLSPQVSKEKEVVRAMLRQAVAAQAIAPYDADQWTKLDTDILKRKIVSENYMKGRTDIKF